MLLPIKTDLLSPYQSLYLLFHFLAAAVTSSKKYVICMVRVGILFLFLVLRGMYLVSPMAMMLAVGSGGNYFFVSFLLNLLG